jgi:hypothetical protein
MADNNNYQVIQNGTNWSIIDVASGTSIVTFTNQDVATQLATSGDFSAANIEKSIYQDINYQSGVQTQADTSTSNVAGNPTTSGDPAIAGSQVVDEAGTVSQFQRNEYGDLYQPLVPPAASSIQTTSSSIPAGQLQNEYGDYYTPLVPISEIQTSNSATAGLTPAQLSALGGADPSDPFIRARLDLPTLGTGVPNLVDSIANNLPNLSNTFPSLSSIQTSIGNTFADIGNLFSSSTPSSIPASDVKSDAIPIGYSKNEYGDLYQTPDLPPASDVQLNASQAESNYQQFVQAFSEADVQTGPSPFEPLAALDETPLVPVPPADDVPESDIQTTTDSVDPTTNPETGTLPSEVSSGFYDNTPIDVDPNVNPEAGFTDVTYPPGSEEALAAEAVDPEVDPEVGGFFGYPPGSDERDGAQPVPEIEAEDQQLVPIPNPEVNADEINGAPQQPADNDWQAEAARTQAENASAAARTSPTGSAESAASQDASVTQGFLDQARQQQTISNQRKQVNNGDWRVRLRLAPMAKYLYNAPSPGILQPLKISDGVIFPYTPSIDTAYKADYEPYALTHSNYKGYFYKSSYVDVINLKCTFTAQSTGEANYLLAVITFFKSVTKMFYGQDAERGAPPPLTYLSGLGEYQFNEHPCLVSQFNYNLPAEVDYIRANSALNVGLNLIGQRDRQTVATFFNKPKNLRGT